MTKTHIVVLVTTSSKEEAEKIANCLLNERLIACANIVGPVHSLFWWTGKIERAEEYVLLMKSHESLFDKLSERIKALHSYDVPEIVALPIVKGYKAYVEWLDSCLK
ncbi:MAG: divalent-cation tolerance protein CutA [Candidatus Bathyarchaeales archaeon]